MLELIGLADAATGTPTSCRAASSSASRSARALAPEPTLVLLDEPFSNLDAALRARDAGRGARDPARRRRDRRLRHARPGGGVEHGRPRRGDARRPRPARSTRRRALRAARRPVRGDVRRRRRRGARPARRQHRRHAARRARPARGDADARPGLGRAAAGAGAGLRSTAPGIGQVRRIEYFGHDQLVEVDLPGGHRVRSPGSARRASSPGRPRVGCGRRRRADVPRTAGPTDADVTGRARGTPMRKRGMLAVVARARWPAPRSPPCSSGGGDALTVYSGRNQELIEPLIDDFEEETGIDVDVRYGDSADLALLIDEEGDNAPADVFLSQSPGAIGFLDGKDRLATAPRRRARARAAERTAPTTGTGSGSRAGCACSSTTRTSSTSPTCRSRCSTSPTPKYKGKVARRADQRLVPGLRHRDARARGDDDARASGSTAWRPTTPATYANNLAIVEAVGRGEIPMGLVNHYYNERAKAEDPDIAGGELLLRRRRPRLADPRDRASACSTPPTSRRRASASSSSCSRSEAQTYFAEETFEYPLARGVEPADRPAAARDDRVAAIDLVSSVAGSKRRGGSSPQSGLEQS